MAAAEDYPEGLKYHAEHDWARIEGDEAILGVTWFAQDALGELVHFEAPADGGSTTKDASYGEVESVKAVSDVIAPLSGEILEVNQKVVDAPETVNDDPVRRGLARADPPLRPRRGRQSSSTWTPTNNIWPSSERRRVDGAGPESGGAGFARAGAGTVSQLSTTDADREEMLAAIGVSSVEELFRDIPAGVRFQGELDLEPALSEPELVRHLEELAAKNVDTTKELSFLGAGIYDHYVPAIVDAVLQRGEFLTAYTPYQPEMSQGVLQAIFEYQTAICELTGMDVSNASGYDGTTVAADACLVAKHATGRARVVLAESLNPQVRQVVKTYAVGFGLEVVEVPARGWVDRPGGRARGSRGCRRRDLPAAERLRDPRERT